MRILYLSRGSYIMTSSSYTATNIENFSNISGCNQSVTFEQCHIIIHIMADFLQKKREELGTKEDGKINIFLESSILHMLLFSSPKPPIS